MDHPDGQLYQKHRPIRARQLTDTDEDREKATKANNVHDFEVGNYLVTGHRGCNYIVQKDIFQEMYSKQAKPSWEDVAESLKIALVSLMPGSFADDYTHQKANYALKRFQEKVESQKKAEDDALEH